MGSPGTELSPSGGCGPELTTMGFPYTQVTLHLPVLLVLTVFCVVAVTRNGIWTRTVDRTGR